MAELKKRSQAERLIIANSLLNEIWREMLQGKVEYEATQIAVDTQVEINRIVWKLNRLNNGG